jgi:HipA-like kinase
VIPTVAVTRYVTPLREGGSLPGIVEADDLGTYVCKFRGAGQGVRVLVAEVIVAGLAERIGLRTPRLVALDLDPEIARYEADEEVQDLLNASAGLNLGTDFLPGSFGFDGHVPPGQAGERSDDPVRILWLDAFVANVDRSWRNPNLLLWHGNLWVIDHGASLYFHHGWAGGVGDPQRFANQAWSAADHIFGDHAAELPSVDAELRGLLTGQALTEIVAGVPDDWLEPVPGAEDREALRAAYVDFLASRLGTRQWLPQAAA